MKRRNENDRPMEVGAGGCNRCDGYVIEFEDIVFSESGGHRCFRCLICGERRWLGDLSSVERYEARHRERVLPVVVVKVPVAPVAPAAPAVPATPAVPALPKVQAVPRARAPRDPSTPRAKSAKATPPPPEAPPPVIRKVIPQIPASGFIRIHQVLLFVTFSKAALLKKVREGSFPAPVKISPQVKAWRCEDLREYIMKVQGGTT